MRHPEGDDAMMPLHPPDELDGIQGSDSEGEDGFDHGDVVRIGCDTALKDQENSKCIENGEKDGLLSLRIKSSVLNKDRELHVKPSTTVATFKRKVKDVLQVSQDRYVRLICKGRLLAPDTGIIADYSIGNGDVIHAVLAAAGVRGGQQAALSHSRVSHGVSGGPLSSLGGQASGRRFYAGSMLSGEAGIGSNGGAGRTSVMIGPGGRVIRMVGREGHDDEDSVSGDDAEWNSDEERGQHRRQLRRERRGFDRLRSTSGLSRAEIAAIRSYFSRQVQRYASQYPSRHSDEPDLPRRRELYEEDWMSAQGPMSEFRFNLNQAALLRFSPGVDGGFDGREGGQVGPRPTLVAGLADGGGGFRSNASNAVIVGTDRDFMWGFMLGFFVGFVMLVWVWMPNVPHKQKLGILTGICFQLALNVLQQDRQDDDLATATLDHADLVAGGLAMGDAGTNYGTVVQDGYR